MASFVVDGISTAACLCCVHANYIALMDGCMRIKYMSMLCSCQLYCIDGWRHAYMSMLCVHVNYIALMDGGIRIKYMSMLCSCQLYCIDGWRHAY